MDVNSIFDIVLGALIAGLGWWIKVQHAELNRVSILLSKTREEVAKEYVHVDRSQADMGRVIDRLDRLEEKLDRLFEK